MGFAYTKGTQVSSGKSAFDAQGNVLAADQEFAGDIVVEQSAQVHAFVATDSAMVMTLPPGTYTAQVAGASGAVGTAMIEIYDIPSRPGAPPSLEAGT
jgi:hypothetical protein